MKLRSISTHIQIGERSRRGPSPEQTACFQRHASEDGFLMSILFHLFVHRVCIHVYKASDGYNISIAFNMYKPFPYVHCAVRA